MSFRALRARRPVKFGNYEALKQSFYVTLPYVKGSGYGREYGPETLHEFVSAKNVRFCSGRDVTPTWPPHK